ncbi:hypothetical protein ACQPXB_38610 [Amycolatopsis sp. CA-161197]|uniref:hypothetical protein n=1 Tax=Amycolatopsis sp. CA-161197 TaxID=3239922 RepID=UPI003D9481BA
MAATEPESTEKAKQRKSRLLQEDVPSCSLEQALRVPRAIAENYAYKPTRPLNVAEAMGMAPTSGPFRAITGAAVAYGLTNGAAQAPEIALTPIGLRIVRPITEGDDLAAKREAALQPKVVGAFLRHYDGAAMPADNIAKNMLQEMGVPSDRTESVLSQIVDDARNLGFIREWNGKRYVDLTGAKSGSNSDVPDSSDSPSLNSGEEIHENGSGPANAVLKPTPQIGVSVTPGVHVNIEIHIAADASSETIEDIFRNMRRYILNDGKSEDDSSGAS